MPLCTLTLTGLFQEPGEGDGGEVAGLVRIAKKGDSGIYLSKIDLFILRRPTAYHMVFGDKMGWFLASHI